MARPRYVGWAAVILALATAGCQHGSTRGAPEPGSVTRPPTAIAPGQPTGWGPSKGEWLAARRAVAGMDDATLAGQVIVAQYVGTDAPTALVARYHLGGVIVFADNVASVPALVSANERLQASDHRDWPLVISTDQEGGIVQRIGAPLTQFPTFMSYGAAGEPALTRTAAKASGDELRAAGFTMVFAPDADVTIGPTDLTIGSRSAGSDPAVVAAQVVAANAGYRQSGIVSVIKHFPGHGSVTTDSHVALPVQDQSLASLEGRDLVPFAAAVRSGAQAVMVGHLAVSAVDPGVPADLSSLDIAVLRHDIGFQGLVTTDALNMGAIADSRSAGDAAVDALASGADMLLMPADVGAAHAAILAALRDGTLPRSRVEEAAARIVALMMHEQRQAPAAPASIGAHEALSEQVSARALTVVSGACLGPYVGRTVTPLGDPSVVAAFTTAARAAGLAVGPGGTTVSLVGYGYGPATADVVVSLDTPYVLATSQAGVARLALFGADAGAMRALVAVLLGRAPADGRLPVSVQGLDEQGRC